MVPNMNTTISLPFVVQKHYKGRVFHWDLMLQRPIEGANPEDRFLATWQLTVEPVMENLDSPVSALPLPDHRGIYLEYQGPITHNRGYCQIVDCGRYDLLEYSENLWRVRFVGRQLIGLFELKKNTVGDSWTLARCPQTDKL
jgi:hypothetical protein